MKTSEVLYTAADLIEDMGWQQGGWGIAYNGKPVLPLCTEGALVAAAGIGSEWWQLHIAGATHEHMQAAKELITNCPAGSAVCDYLDYNDLADWNDAPERTAAEVIEVLRAAAVIEAAREQRVVDELAANGVTAVTEAAAS